MGIYLHVPYPKNKVDQLKAAYQAEEIMQPSDWSKIPKGKTLIVVVDNGPFEAAAVAYCKSEFTAFIDPGDRRPKRYVLVDEGIVARLTGMNRRVQ